MPSVVSLFFFFFIRGAWCCFFVVDKNDETSQTVKVIDVKF